MLLVCDIGNTRAKLGVFTEGVTPLRTWSFQKGAKEEEIEQDLAPVWDEVDQVVVGSVNPQQTQRWGKIFQQWGKKWVEVTPGWKFGFVIRYRGVVGVDRLCALEAAAEFCGVPVAVFSFGSALTASIINPRNEFIGGWIFPGYEMCWDVLSEKTALIPPLEYPKDAPKEVFGDHTEMGIQAGMFYAFTGIVEKWKALIHEQFGNIPVVATGGYADFFRSHFSAVYPFLVLQGLYRVFTRSLR